MKQKKVTEKTGLPCSVGRSN